MLDADLLIALEQDDETAVEWLHAHRHEEHVVPDVVVVEYLTGHTAAEAALDAVDEAFRIGYATQDWIVSTVELRKGLRRKKVRFRTPDFWIAAWAHHVGGPVVTRYVKHFAQLGVEVEDWSTFTA